ncbi:mevalonate kinase [Sesbania bispinosa]|nr:mevalonate kinase [Sesbania bispinosa]
MATVGLSLAKPIVSLPLYLEHLQVSSSKKENDERMECGYFYKPVNGTIVGAHSDFVMSP